jgi:2-amino-4-hydroxy-6-hydroxymethyldihydropteridine diphosphokinase
VTKLDTLGKQARITYLGIGSNIGNKKDNIEKAKSLLIENNINLISVSSYYNTPSWPNPKNPDFINIVVKS